MPNIFDFLRMKNLFDRPPEVYGNDLPEQGRFTGMLRSSVMEPPQDPSFPSKGLFPSSNFKLNTPQQDSDIDVMGEMNRLYAPEHTASDAFNQAINQYPSREANKPSFGRRLGAALSAFGPGGYEAGKEVLDKPFREKQEDWIRRIGPLGQAAGIERQSNSNERLMAYQTVAAKLRDQAQQAKEANDLRRSEIASHRAAIYEFKAMHPGMKFVLPRGGNVMAMDPITGKQMDTGIPTGSMTRIDELNLMDEMKSERMEQQGQQNKELESQRQGNRVALADRKGWSDPITIEDPDDPTKRIAISVNKDTGETRRIQVGKKDLQNPQRLPGGGAGRVGGGLTPIQINRQRNNRAREIRDSMPDLAQWIKLKGSNDFEISSRTPPEIRKIIIKYIDGDLGGLDVSQPGRSNTANSADNTAPKAPQSKYQVTIK